MTFEEITAAVKAERGRQDAKWGTSFYGRSDHFWNTILSEEVGEVANAILEHDEPEMELIQVAAVVFSWLEFRTPESDQPEVH